MLITVIMEGTYQKQIFGWVRRHFAEPKICGMIDYLCR